MVEKIPDSETFFKLTRNENKFILVDFHAVWCGPCKFIAPVLETLSKKYENVNVVKVEYDSPKLIHVKKRYKVQAVPTFVVLYNEKEVYRFVGASKAHLLETIKSFDELYETKSDDKLISEDAINQVVAKLKELYGSSGGSSNILSWLPVIIMLFLIGKMVKQFF